MSETGLPPGPPSGAFSAAEQDFFQQGEALESATPLDEPIERRRPTADWRPRLILMGVAMGAGLLALSLAGGRRPGGEAVAAVTVSAMPAPTLPGAPAPEPAASTAVAAPPSLQLGRPSKVKRSKHAHRTRLSGPGKRR
jgi:hypothetical protein